jgi:hypothetical protein
MERDTKIFGDIYLDTDSDPKVNKGSDYTLNTIIQSDGRFGVAVNIKGNELVTDGNLLNTVLPNPFSQPIKVVGSCVDEARNRIVYFLTNYINISGSYVQAILYYDISTGENKAIVYGDYFGFTYDTVIHANIIGDLLIWVEAARPPRKINYIKAYNLTNSITTDYKYQVLNSSIIELYKNPPSIPISASPAFSLDAKKVISNKIYQFSYRYVYGDYEKSVLAPFSYVTFSDDRYFPDGSGVNYTSAYAIILYFKLYTQISGVFNDVDAVELFVRNSDFGNWYLYDKISTPKINSFTWTYFAHGTFDDGSGSVQNNDRGSVSKDTYDRLTIGQYLLQGSSSYYIAEKFTSGANYIIGLNNTIGTSTYTFDLKEDFQYLFKDDKVKQDVDQVDLARPYDFIPKLAGTQELIEKDKLILGDITEGFNNTDVDVDTSVIVNSYPTMGAQLVAGHFEPLTTVGKAYYKLYWESYPQGYYSVVANYKTTGGVTGNIGASYVSGATDSETSILNIFLNIFKSYGLTDTTLVTSGYKYLRVPHNGGLSGDWGTSGEMVFSFGLNDIRKSLKNNDSYLGSIRYYDSNLRFTGENKFQKEIITPKNNVDSFKEYTSLLCSIKNKPPIDAYYYSLCFTKRCKTDSFIRVLVPQGYSYVDPKDGLLKLQLNRLINDSIDRSRNLKLKTYTFTPGDRISIFGGYILGMLPMFNSDTPFFNDFIYDIEIKGEEWPTTDARYQKDYATTPSYILDVNGNKIYSPSSQVLVLQDPHTGVGDLSNLMIEVYTPKKESSNPYYFPNYFNKIGNPGTVNNYHIGTNQNQNPLNPVLTPAIVECNPGDVYLKFRYAVQYYPALDDNYSDYYESNSYGYGMPGLFNPDAKEERLVSGMRYSGSLLEDTKVNKLNQFKSADLEILKSKFGTINSLKEVGNLLKVLQDKKETSIYISRTEMQNADNTSNVVKSTALLGTANASEENRGTIFSKSVIVHNRNMYYFDLYRAEVIRSSSNGQFPISEYGMRTYFKNKARQIQDVGIANVDVISAFDEENKMYLLTFITPTDSETIGFYDPEVEGAKPRWISFYSFIPDHYESFGTALLSFKNGAGYKHNSINVNRGTFYGVKYKQQVNWYSNLMPTIKKVFKSIGIKSNKAWSVPIIIIEADATYPRGFLSKLNTNHFTLKEGVYSASYLNNMLTKSSTPSNVELLNGEFLRGYYIKHQMENLENGEVWIMSVDVNTVISNTY